MNDDTIDPGDESLDRAPRATVHDLFVPAPEGVQLRKSHAMYTAEQRLDYIERAKPMLFAGVKLDEVARDLGIPPRTLDYWLAQLGDEYRQLRRAWIDHKLTRAEEMLVDAPNKLEVLRAKALMQVAQWYAERRDPERYAPKQEITHKDEDPRTPEQVRARISELEKRLGVKTIDAETVTESTQPQ